MEGWKYRLLPQVKPNQNKGNQFIRKNNGVFSRLGLVPVGEASVVVAISSTHRSESLDAVRYAIDSLKERVPIWKKEVYDQGSEEWKANSECSWAAIKSSN